MRARREDVISKPMRPKRRVWRHDDRAEDGKQEADEDDRTRHLGPYRRLARSVTKNEKG